MHTPNKNGNRGADLSGSHNRQRKLKLPPESEKNLREKAKALQEMEALPHITGNSSSRNYK
jgi:hypothetical protein